MIALTPGLPNAAVATQPPRQQTGQRPLRPAPARAVDLRLRAGQVISTTAANWL